MIFEGNDSRCLLEVCIAYIRFWVTNPSYRKVLSAYNKETLAEEHSFADIDALIKADPKQWDQIRVALEQMQTAKR